MTPDPINPASAIRELAEKLLPDEPTYVLLGSEHPAQFGFHGAIGLQGDLLDVSAMAHLGEKYTGRHAAVYLNDVVMATEFREQSFAVLLHELGHVLTNPADLREPTPAVVKEAAQEHARTAMFYSAPRDFPPWFPGKHDLGFLRACAHLTFRARWLAEPIVVPFGKVVACDLYGLSPAARWWAILLPECRRLQAVPLPEVMEQKPDREARALWMRDVRAWKAQAGELNKFTKHIVNEALNKYRRKSR